MIRNYRSVPLALLLLAACNGDESFDQEVIVQLFKPQGANLGPIKVTASQGSTQSSATLDAPFGDCEANKLRIVPKQQDGSYADVTIRAEATNGDTFAQATVEIPSSGIVKLVLGTPGAGGIEPAGDCAPDLRNDAGVADAGVEDDAAPERREIGEPCARPEDCKDGTCINDFSTSVGASYQLSGGYCTKDCASDKRCDGSASCELSSTPGGLEFGWYCLRTCSGGNPCTRTDFQCRGSFCLP